MEKNEEQEELESKENRQEMLKRLADLKSV